LSFKDAVAKASLPTTLKAHHKLFTMALTKTSYNQELMTFFP